MAGTLKERYETKKIGQLRERVSRADAQLLREERAARLILEAMDQEDLDKVTAIIEKLNNVKKYNVKSLNDGIDAAIAELNKYTAGGPLVKAWSKLKSKVGIDNPVIKITTLASALEKGFSQLPQILKNNGVDLKNVNVDNETLQSAITRQAIDKLNNEAQGDSGPPTISTKDIENTDKANKDPKVKQKIDTVVAQLRKALAPGGIFGAFKKVPYVDTQALVNDLMNAPLKNFSGLVKDVNSGTKAAEVAPDMKDQVTGHGGAETKGATPGGEAKPTGGTQPSAAPKGAVTTDKTKEPGETPAEPRGGGAAAKGVDVQKVAARIKPAVEDLGVKDVNKLVAALEDLGVLKNPE